MLDDVFSGLDADTEEQVFQKVFGPSGLLKRRSSTVVLCTHSVRHLPAADYIIALGEGTIVEQGNFDKLMTLEGYVHGLGLKGFSDNDASSEDIKSNEGERTLTAQPLYKTTATNTASVVPDADESRQLGDMTVYKYYFKSMGSLLAAASIFFAALWGFFTNFPTICELISSLHADSL